MRVRGERLLCELGVSSIHNVHSVHNVHMKRVPGDGMDVVEVVDFTRAPSYFSFLAF